MKHNLSMEIQKVHQQQRGEGLYYLRISGRFVDPQEIFLELPPLILRIHSCNAISAWLEECE